MRWVIVLMGGMKCIYMEAARYISLGGSDQNFIILKQ